MNAARASAAAASNSAPRDVRQPTRRLEQARYIDDRCASHVVHQQRKRAEGRDLLEAEAARVLADLRTQAPPPA